MKNNQTENTTKEQIISLKDGRTIFKTHNGFKSFVEDTKGIVTEVTSEYYDKAKRLSKEPLAPNQKTRKKWFARSNSFVTGRDKFLANCR